MLRLRLVFAATALRVPAAIYGRDDGPKQSRFAVRVRSIGEPVAAIYRIADSFGASATGANAMIAHDVAADEMNWLRPCGNPVS
jgi:hypothetical protein